MECKLYLGISLLVLVCCIGSEAAFTFGEYTLFTRRDAHGLKRGPGLSHGPGRGPQPGTKYDTASTCKDKRVKECKGWESKGYCSKTSTFYTYVTNNCRKSCKLCTEASCRDTSKYCARIARSKCNYNQRNVRLYNYMKRYCRLKCGFCNPTYSVSSGPSALKGCTWEFGDGTGKHAFEKDIGKVSAPQECFARCQKYNLQGLKPNGATVDARSGRRCYCEFRMTRIQQASQRKYRTCKFASSPALKGECTFEFGDGTGTNAFEKNIGVFSGPQECFARCQMYNYQGQKPNGATVDARSGRRCYCEFRMTRIQQASQREYRTCKFASGPGCSAGDQRVKCVAWRKKGYCNRKVVLRLCPVTCGQCGCKDENRHCKTWFKRGECNKNPYYMKVKCRKSCNTCYQSKSKTKPQLKPTPPLVRPSSLLNSEYCGMTSVERVVGGQATKPGAWPWMVALERKSKIGQIICGASLLTDEWVLSATHCFLGEGKDDPSKYMVRIGEHHLKQSGTELNVKLDRIITHENFDKINYNNDVALLHLAERINFTPKIRPACISDQGELFADGTNCTVTGWGYLEEGKAGPDVLHSAKVPIVNHKLCVDTFKELYEEVTDVMICAGHAKGGIDSCSGDSGGPLVCRGANGGRYKQAGVISWGYGCARENLFGVYAKLSAMRNWIESKVNPK